MANWRWILELSLTLLAVAVLPVGLGILIDLQLGTAPLLTLGMMFLGFNLGILTIYRRIAGIYSHLAPPDLAPHQASALAFEAARSARNTRMLQPFATRAADDAPAGNQAHLGGDSC